MSADRSFAVALVGCGSWGRHILRDLRHLGCTVTVVAPTDDSRRRALDGGADAIVAAIDDLDAVDGAVVASPTSTHAAVVEQLLPLRIPVFVEKPLTADVDEARALLRSDRRRIFVMDKWRYHPGVEALRDIASSGRLGPVIGIETTRIGWGRPHTDVDGIWTLGPHDLSIILEVLGALPEPQAAVADWAGDELAGLIGLLGDDPWATIRVATRSTTRRREVVLRCRDGIAVLSDGCADSVQILPGYRIGDAVPDPTLVRVSDELPLLRELRAFVAHLAGGPPPRSSAAEGLAVVEALTALRGLAGVDEPGDLR